MTRRRLWTACLVVLLLVTAGVLAYPRLRNATAAQPLTLEATQPSAASGPPPAGTWRVENGLVGYRITEPGNVTIVGRTESVTGDLVVSDAGTTSGDNVAAADLVLTSVDVTADLGQLRSDAAGRDTALRSRILETDEFPEASFSLTSPVDLPAVTAGEPVALKATGELDIRDRRHPVDVELSARWDGDQLRVVGRIPILLSDYAVEVSSVAGVDTINDAALVELDLTLSPPTQQG